MSNYNNKEQKRLGSKGLVALIAFLSAFTPLSTDLYLPSLPGMSDYFQAPVNIVNLTLILFFIFYSAGILFWGPLSDRFGRRPVLLAGMLVYAAASLMCACAGSIYQLIIFRVFQAAGGSSASAVATAMVKDVYDGRKRESILALVNSMVVVAPAVAPVLGAAMLNFTTWRGVFWILTGAGLLALAGAAALEETLEERYTGTILQTIGRLGTVLKNPGFSSLLLVFSLCSIPMLSFVASSSYIYIKWFGLSEQVYSYFFALNALCLLFGPLLYINLSGRFYRSSIIAACFVSMILGGLLVRVLGNYSPWLFAVSLISCTVAGSCMRPPGTNLMLEQQREDTGSASSLMGCCALLMGSLGMFLISLNWANTIFALGIINFLTGLTGGAFWLLFSKKPFIKQVPDAFAAAPARQAR